MQALDSKVPGSVPKAGSAFATTRMNKLQLFLNDAVLQVSGVGRCRLTVVGRCGATQFVGAAGRSLLIAS